MALTLDQALETAIENVGGMGLFQILLIVIVNGSKFAIAFGMLLMSFGAKIPDWWCVDDEFTFHNHNHTAENYQNCYYKNATECKTIEYSDDFNTIVSSYDLVCSRRILASTITSIQLAGVFIGCLVAGQIAELIGRKKTFFALILMHAIFNAISIFDVNWVYFAVVRFFIGATVGGLTSMEFSIPIEFTATKWRMAMVMIPSWGMGALVFALASYLVHDWYHLTIITAVVTLPFLFGWFLVPESVRWLISKGRYDDARQSLLKVARINRKGKVDLSVIDKLENSHLDIRPGKKHSFLDLIRTKEMAKKTIPSIFVWTSMGLGYFGTIFGVVALSGNIYVNLTISALVDIPANIIVAFMSNRIGRKRTNLISFAIGSAAALTIVPVSYLVEDPMRGNVINGLAMTCKFGLGCGWMAYKLHTAELFPTVVRTLSSGICNAASRIGAIIAPQLIYLTQLEGSLMYLIIGIVSAISAFASQLVDETRGVALREVVESNSEADRIGLSGKKENPTEERDHVNYNMIA